MRTLRVDGINYHVNLKYATLLRSFSILEGNNKGDALTGRTIRDIIGTRYDYELAIEQDPDYPYDYDKFYEVISSPVESHIVTFPYGQGSLTYECIIEDGSDAYMGTYAGTELWEGLVIRFIAIEPRVNSHVAPGTKYLDTQTIIPGTENIILSAGYYLSGPQTILGDEDLRPENIKFGVDIFGVRGVMVPEGGLVVMSEETVREAFIEGWEGTNE